MSLTRTFVEGETGTHFRPRVLELRPQLCIRREQPPCEWINVVVSLRFQFLSHLERLSGGNEMNHASSRIFVIVARGDEVHYQSVVWISYIEFSAMVYYRIMQVGSIYSNLSSCCHEPEAPTVFRSS